MSPCAIEPELADRCSTVCASRWSSIRTAGERLRLSLEQAGDYCRFSISRPAALRSVGDEQLFDPRPVAAGEDLALGIGFALRLVRGLARIAGGDLVDLAGRDHPAGSARLTWRAAAACLSRIGR